MNREFTITWLPNGWFFLTAPNGANGESRPYDQPATVMYQGKKFIAFSAYWSDIAGQKAKVFELGPSLDVQEIDDSLKKPYLINKG